MIHSETTKIADVETARAALIAADEWSASEADQLEWALKSGASEDRARCAANLGEAARERNEWADELAMSLSA